jgi:hypothetical protein
MDGREARGAKLLLSPPLKRRDPSRASNQYGNRMAGRQRYTRRNHTSQAGVYLKDDGGDGVDEEEELSAPGYFCSDDDDHTYAHRS